MARCNVMLSVVMLNVIMPDVVAPLDTDAIIEMENEKLIFLVTFSFNLTSCHDQHVHLLRAKSKTHKTESMITLRPLTFGKMAISRMTF